MTAEDLVNELQRLINTETAKACDETADKFDRIESGGKALGLLTASRLLLESMTKGDIN